MKIHTLKRTCWIAIVISVISLILTAINIWAYIKNKWYLLLYSLNLESLGEGNFIFVGSSTDEWAANVPSEWIEQVLDYCDGFNNRYLLLVKTSARFLEYLDHPVMKKSVLCTTIETNRFYPDIMRNTPVPQERRVTKSVHR